MRCEGTKSKPVKLQTQHEAFHVRCNRVTDWTRGSKQDYIQMEVSIEEGEYEHDYDERWHRDLLQGLGQGATCCLQPWLAAERGRMGRPDDLSGRPRISLRRA